MKKQFALLLMLLLAHQLSMLAQDSLPAHKSQIVYQFFSSFVTVENNFITDPVRNKPPWNHFIHGGTEEKLEVTGEGLKIDVFNKIPTGIFKQHYTGSWLKDTTAADSAAFALKDLQVSISFNGQPANWKNVTSLPAFADTVFKTQIPVSKQKKMMLKENLASNKDRFK